MQTVREKRRGGARPAALAVAVIAAMLVPAGAAAADTDIPTEDSGVVAEQPAPVTTTEAEPAPEPAADPAPAEESAPVEPTTTEPAATEPAAQPAVEQDTATSTSSTEESAPDAPPSVPSTPTTPTTPTTSTETTSGSSELGTMGGSFSFLGVDYDAEEDWTTARVDTPVQAIPSSEWPADAFFDIDWYTDGGTHVGEGMSYFPTSADLGKDLSIAWTVMAPGYTDHNGGMSVAGEILPAGSGLPTMPGQVDVSGVTVVQGESRAYVGQTLTAALDASWPAGAEVSWSWQVDHRVRSESSTFTPDLTDFTGTVWLYADVTAPGYADRHVEVLAASVVLEAPPVQQGTVKVVGTDGYEVVLGKTLQLDVAGWPADATEQISWSVNNQVRGSGRTFTPAVSDLGGYVQVAISITAPGMHPHQDYFWLGTVVTTPKVSVPSSSITVGDVATIPVSVSGPQGGPVATGLVTVTLTPQGGGTPLVLPSASLVDGVATFTAANLPVGTYTVDAAYTTKQIQYSFITLMAADHAPAYRSATGSGVLTVGAAAAKLTAPGTVRAAVATRATFEATLATNGFAPTGAWTVREGGSVLAQGEVRKDGRIAVTLPVLSVGTHTLVLDVPATPWASAASATVTVVVTGEPAQVGTAPTVGTVLETPKAATAPGQQMELVAEGFVPGETVAFYLHSEPMFLGTAVAGADGVARLMATVPAGAPVGSHTVIATGGTSGRWATLAVELAVPAAVTPVANPVAAAPAAVPAATPPLAVTGSQSGTLMAGAWLMLLVGGGLVLVARRVRATR